MGISIGTAVATAMGAAMSKWQENLTSSLSKKAKMEGDVSEEEEDTVLVEENIDLKDNSQDIVDMALRMKIRVPSAPANDWWSRGWSSQRTTRPVRGSSLYMDNVQGATRPSDSTLKRCHDRMADMKIIYFASKNQDLTSDSRTIKHKGASSWTVEKDWQKLETVEVRIRGWVCLVLSSFLFKECVDAVDNWVHAVWLIRSVE